ncbi:MAG: glycosyltransferase family 4 protein, partial [Paludibacter sp.]|nr:glycosyltransferase family 4 protein [Paludibacter sp.]
MDYLLESLLEAQGVSFNRFTWKSGNVREKNANGNVDIIKLCGDIHELDTICFTYREIEDAAASAAFQRCISDLSQQPFVFIGYRFFEDAIGTEIVKTIRDRSENTIVDPHMDIKMHRKLVFDRNCNIPESAEAYLKEEIVKSAPTLTVKHIIFRKDGIGGVQTYYYALNKLVEKEPKLKFSCESTFDYFNESEISEQNAYGFTYLRAVASAKIHEVIAQGDFDVIHAHDIVSAYFASTMRVPVVYTSHSLISEEQKYVDEGEEIPYEKDAQTYEEQYYPMVPQIITLSESYRATLPSVSKHSAKVLKAPFLWHQLPECVASYSDLIKPINSENKRAFDPTKKTITYVGRASKRKGFDVFIDALNHLVKDYGHNDIQMLFVGPEVRMLNKAVSNEEIRESSDVVEVEVEYEKDGSPVSSTKSTSKPVRVSFVDMAYSVQIDFSNESDLEEHNKRLQRIYSSTDIVVIPSLYEPFGYVAIEAMASRCLVVANEVGGLRETIGESQERGLFAKDCGQGLAAGFAYTLDFALKAWKSEDVKVKIENAYNWVTREYSEVSNREIVHELYQKYLSAVVQGDCFLFDSSFSNDELAKKYYSLRDEVKDNISMYDSLREILIEAAYSYRNLINRMNMQNDERLEAYDLFWEMARWIK